MGAGEVGGKSVLPEDPMLAAAAAALHEGGQIGWIADADWQMVFISDEMQLAYGSAHPDLPAPFLGTAWTDYMLAADRGIRPHLFGEGPRGDVRMMLADLGRAVVEARADPRLHDMLEGLEPAEAPVLTWGGQADGIDGQQVTAISTGVRLRDENRLVGTVITMKPAIGMTTLSRLAIYSDPGHLERMQRVASPARRPAAILFADLEGSSPLARRLSTAAYFSLTRRLVRTADDCVVDAGGLVGRHVGDGVTAFFLAEDAGSEAAAARACIDAARTMREAIPALAERSNLDADDLVVRMGLHWGATLYVGNITSRGRSEVTALGSEVNEAARIEACANGGRILASKDLVERLDHDAAAALGIDPDHILYTALADLPHATEKARRDAPAISVCEI
ncbi:MAG TPA: adenylate/guanylate cyclase domain-containing protein [Acidimicrobiales bacterium]|nr:adenylate/guanylate cyclase domain-containing protein [Acidimicrobiales bacterium]